jgi:hypothetical protein
VKGGTSGRYSETARSDVLNIGMMLAVVAHVTDDLQGTGVRQAVSTSPALL